MFGLSNLGQSFWFGLGFGQGRPGFRVWGVW